MKIAILGGGISGLACAYRLRELSALHKIPLKIALFEAAPRLGGVIRSESRGGFLLEEGPDTFISQKPWAADLARRLGLGNELTGVREEHRQSSIVYRGCLRPVPKGFYLLASPSFKTLWSLPFISWRGKCRMALEPWVPAGPVCEDESAAAFIRRRFGEEALWRIGQPMIGGITAADPEKLSLRSTFPQFLEWERRYGSVIRGLRTEARRKRGASALAASSGPRYHLFLSFKRGMQTLTDRLAESLEGADLQTSKEAVSLRPPPAPAAGWQIGFRDGTAAVTDAVCLALPARAAQVLLKPFAAEAAGLLDEIRSEPAVTINLAFRRQDLPALPRGAGFVIPQIEGYPLIGVTFAQQKFEGRAPQDGVLVRAFAGGCYRRELLNRTDQELESLVLKTLADLLKIRAQPLWTRSMRFSAALPQLTVGHAARAAQLRNALEAQPGLFVTGNYFSGVGIPDCVHEAEETADKIMHYLISHPPARPEDHRFPLTRE